MKSQQPTRPYKWQPRKVLTPEQKWACVEMYREERPTREITSALGVSWGVIRRVLVEAGTEIRPRGRKRLPPKEGLPPGYQVTDEGYVLIWHGDTKQLQHRVVMEEELGRPLRRDETVHHINGNHRDNRRGNLQLRNGAHGSGIVLRCGDCGSRNLVPEPL